MHALDWRERNADYSLFISHYKIFILPRKYTRIFTIIYSPDEIYMLSQRVFKQHRGIKQSSNTNNRMLVNIYRERLLDAAHRSSMTVTLSLEWYLADVRSRLFWNAKHLNLGHYSRGQSQKKNQQCYKQTDTHAMNHTVAYLSFS